RRRGHEAGRRVYSLFQQNPLAEDGARAQRVEGDRPAMPLELDLDAATLDETELRPRLVGSENVVAGLVPRHACQPGEIGQLIIREFARECALPQRALDRVAHALQSGFQGDPADEDGAAVRTASG